MSASYSASIQPDRKLRSLVLVSGSVFAVLGIVLIVLQPISTYWRLLLLGVWLPTALIGLLRHGCAYRVCAAYRLYADGNIDVQTANGTSTACYAAGSVIGRRLVWLRLRPSEGLGWAELIAGNARKNEDWRRLQVICRLQGPC